MTQAVTWIQYLALLMWFTYTKESGPSMDNPFSAIILSKRLSSISEPQRKRIDFSKRRDPKKQKYFSEPNLSGNLHWSSFNNLYTAWLLSFGQDSTVVLSFQQPLSNVTVCQVCVWVHQLREKLLKCQVFLYDDSSGNGTMPMQSKLSCTSCVKLCYFVLYSVSVIAVWGGWKWYRRQFRRHGKCLQWSKEVFSTCLRRWKCINFQEWSVVRVF